MHGQMLERNLFACSFHGVHASADVHKIWWQQTRSHVLLFWDTNYNELFQRRTRKNWSRCTLLASLLRWDEIQLGRWEQLTEQRCCLTFVVAWWGAARWITLGNSDKYFQKLHHVDCHKLMCRLTRRCQSIFPFNSKSFFSSPPANMKDYQDVVTFCFSELDYDSCQFAFAPQFLFGLLQQPLGLWSCAICTSLEPGEHANKVFSAVITRTGVTKMGQFAFWWFFRGVFLLVMENTTSLLGYCSSFFQFQWGIAQLRNPNRYWKKGLNGGRLGYLMCTWNNIAPLGHLPGHLMCWWNSPPPHSLGAVCKRHAGFVRWLSMRSLSQGVKQKPQNGASVFVKICRARRGQPKLDWKFFILFGKNWKTYVMSWHTVVQFSATKK